MGYISTDLAWPIYVFLALSSGILVTVYFIKNSSKYQKEFTWGICLIGAAAFFAGIVKLILEFGFVKVSANYIMIIVFVGVFIGLPLILVGTYKNAGEDKKLKRIIWLAALLLFLFALLSLIIVIDFNF